MERTPSPRLKPQQLISLNWQLFSRSFAPWPEELERSPPLGDRRSGGMEEFIGTGGEGRPAYMHATRVLVRSRAGEGRHCARAFSVPFFPVGAAGNQ
jgi:hypothetical protein